MPTFKNKTIKVVRKYIYYVVDAIPIIIIVILIRNTNAPRGTQKEGDEICIRQFIIIL